jgi:SsrA-binding protein
MKTKLVEIVNRRASFEYKIIDTYTAGIVLSGTEVKAIRDARVNLSDSFCYFYKGELYVRNLHISEYSFGSYNNHDPKRLRKLLLTARELRKLQTKVKERGFSIVPLRLFESDRSLLKLEIALVTGKKHYDKRESIKAREDKRTLDRVMREKGKVNTL